MFGLQVSLGKIKLIVVRCIVQDEKRVPILVGYGEIKCVDEFIFLGSIIASNYRMDAEVDKSIENASNYAFGALHSAVFKDVQTCEHHHQAGRCSRLVCCQCCCMTLSAGLHYVNTSRGSMCLPSMCLY